MSDILQKIVAVKREELAAWKKAQPLAEVRDQAESAPPAFDFTGSLRGPRPRRSETLARSSETPARGSGITGGEVNIIAEIKRRSPSKGEFPWHGDVARQVRAYEQGGAKVISVVTDQSYFGGSVEMLRQVKRLSPLPVLQKDFLLDPWQVHYARSLGADACLLIAAILPGDELAEMVAEAKEARLHTLVEVVDEGEFDRATSAGAIVIGVNNRNLKTFQVDTRRTEMLLPLFAEEQVCISESGIRTPEDIARLLRAGADGFLIGEALMTAQDPAGYLENLRGRSLRKEAAS